MKVTPLKVALASDHAAVVERQALAKHLKAAGHEVTDFGPDDTTSVDYPDFAELVAHAVAGEAVDFGVVLCTTGIGVCMAANKVDGIRAATVSNSYTAEMTRRHNNANVICMGAGIHATAAIIRAVDVFLATSFDGGRHARRVEKIDAIQRRAPAASDA